MANPVVRAFNLALAGDAKELGAMLTAKDVDASAAREDGMYRGWTLLHAAAGKNHEAAVEVLLAAGADATLKNPQGRTPAEQATVLPEDRGPWNP